MIEKWIHHDNPKRWRSCINIGIKAEYPLFEASVQHLVRSARWSLLWAAQIERNYHKIWLSSIIDGFEQSDEEKTAAIRARTRMVLSQQQYSPDIVLSDYHLFWSMDHCLVEQHFHSYEDAKMSRHVGSLEDTLSQRGIQSLQENGKRVLANNGQ